MNRDLDDDTIAKLVRDTAAGWTMPPVRLDAPSWRERVRRPRARRIAVARGWFGRLGQAATAAVALTVVGALVAVVLTRPLQPASSPGATGAQTPGQTTGPSAAAQASGLPKLILQGDLPDPSKVIVQTESGAFELVDLETGSVGSPSAGGRHGSAARVLEDGTLACLCLDESRLIDQTPTVASVSLDRFAADGTPLSSTPIGTFTGTPDPRDEGTVVPERPPHVLTAMSFSADGRYGFVGWSLRAHPAWKSGMIVIDLANGGIVERIQLADTGTGEGDARRIADAPTVAGMADATHLIVARSWLEWQPVTSESPSYTLGNDIDLVAFANHPALPIQPLPEASNCGDFVIRAGPGPAGRTWLACSRGSGDTVVRRLTGAGASFGDIHVSGTSGIEGDMTAVSGDGNRLFVWDPAAAKLTRIDLTTGNIVTGQGAGTAAAVSGPLSALGDWLAPVAAAKSFLSGGILVSPDGARIYAIGVRSASSGPEAGGSTGVFVFDAETLANGASYAPTADFVSLALSKDGKSLYASGLPGVDAAGKGNRRFSSSITVFDTDDGSVRVIAGQLGGEVISFVSSTLH